MDWELIDSHLHLDFDDFAEDLPEVLARAREAGVCELITIGTGLSSSQRALEIATEYPGISVAVGLHPHQAGEASDEVFAGLRAMLSHPKVVAVGECGLDYFYMHAPRDVQREAFRAQVKMAQETGYPLVIHTRDAEEDTLQILAEEQQQGNPYRGVIHCFSGSLELAEACMEMGFFLSISGMVTFIKSLHKVIRKLPLERLLIETDAPYLAPVPHRGARNEPAYVRFTAEKLARILRIPVAELVAHTTKNTRELFSL